MYCPKCKSEYIVGIKVCPVCKEDLVNDLPENHMDYDSIKPVMLKSVANDIEAGIIMNLLQNNNIPCFKKDKGIGGYMNLYMGYSVYGEDIYVGENDYEKAVQIINELSENEEAIEANDEAINVENTREISVPFYKKPHIIARIILGVMVFYSILAFLVNNML